MEPYIKNGNSPFVSVIIPVYNVEKYFSRCMESIFAQTYDNFEVILVDDGSTDSSAKMCDDFSKTDNRVNVFHKKNGGLSDARNFGVKHANSNYIIFVDSDDYVSDDYIEYLVHLREMYNADVAITKVVPYTGDDYNFNTNAGAGQCLTVEDALIKMMYRTDFNVSAYGKIYRKDLVEAHPYPVGLLYEDLATTYKIIADCNIVAYGACNSYCYRQRPGSIMNQNIDEKHLYGIVIAKEELRYMEQHFPNAVNAAKYSVVHIIVRLIDNAIYGIDKGHKNFQYLRNELRPYFLFVLRDNNIRIIRKIRCMAIMLGYYPTALLWKLIDIAKKSEKNIL